MGAAPGDRRPCGGRHGAHIHFSRPDHAADAAGEADGPHQNPETGGRADEARPGIARQLVIGMAEPDEKAIKPGPSIFCAIW
jgi:hypothetical protein